MANDPNKIGQLNQDQALFAQRVEADFAALEKLAGDAQRFFPPVTPHASTDPDYPSLQRLGGLELETLLVSNRSGALTAPPPAFWEQLAACSTAHYSFTVEASVYAVEINLAPFPIANEGFATMYASLVRALSQLKAVASRYELSVIGVGMAPSTRLEDLGAEAITDAERYQLLNGELLAHHQGQVFELHGQHEHLQFTDATVALVGAGTSAQFHFMGEYERFANVFNASQVIAPLLVGLSAHSPFLHGAQLAHETRLQTFQAFTDTRTAQEKQQGLPARVDLGSGWAHSALQALTHDHHLHRPLVPNVAGLLEADDPLALVDRGHLPPLQALGRSKGTQWPHNRAVYATTGADARVQGAFLRVESRCMASGGLPEVWANSVFAAGLIHALSTDTTPVHESFEFAKVRSNLDAAISTSMSSTQWWPMLGEVPLPQLVKDVCLPLAKVGLADLQVSESIALKALGMIEQRCHAGTNGAVWTAAAVQRLQEQGESREQALAEVTLLTARNQTEGTPQHKWPLPTSRASLTAPIRPATTAQVPAQRPRPAAAPQGAAQHEAISSRRL